MQNLTKRQAETLDLIERSDIPPTLREIGSVMRIASTNGVNDHIRALYRKGRLANPNDPSGSKSRNLRVVRPLTAEERRLYGLGQLSRCGCCGQRITSDNLPGGEMLGFGEDVAQKLAEVS